MTGSIMPTSAVMAVGKSFVAILRGVNPVTGLKLTRHAKDFVAPPEGRQCGYYRRNPDGRITGVACGSWCQME